MSKIISLTDIIDSKVVKEKEIQYYYEQLEEIQRKIAFLETDLNLTKTIIRLIEDQKIVTVDNNVPLIGVKDDDDEG
jgi:hypothetical protein